MAYSLIRRGIPFIVLALIAGIVTFSLAVHGTAPRAMAQNAQHSATPMPGMQMPQEFDLVFIDMMILHHQGAIAMAEVALTEGEHQEIRDLATAIIESQQGEIDQLNAWRDAWYPDAPEMPMDQMTQMMGGMMQMPSMMGTPPMGMMGMPSMQGHMGDPAADAEALRNETGPFDQAFIEDMIPHHQSAVAMAQVALQNAIHPEIATLAQEIIDAQQREIAEMQSWLAEWYGGTPVAASSGVERVEVVLTEFGIQSSVTTFESNKVYLFSVTNAGTIPHEFMIMPRMDGMGQMDMSALHDTALLVIPVEDLPPGATQTVEVTLPENVADGEVEFICAEPAHYDSGMALVVTVA